MLFDQIVKTYEKLIKPTIVSNYYGIYSLLLLVGTFLCFLPVIMVMADCLYPFELNSRLVAEISSTHYQTVLMLSLGIAIPSVINLTFEVISSTYETYNNNTNNNSINYFLLNILSSRLPKKSVKLIKALLLIAVLLPPCMLLYNNQNKASVYISCYLFQKFMFIALSLLCCHGLCEDEMQQETSKVIEVLHLSFLILSQLIMVLCMSYSSTNSFNNLLYCSMTIYGIVVFSTYIFSLNVIKSFIFVVYRNHTYDSVTADHILYIGYILLMLMDVLFRMRFYIMFDPVQVFLANDPTLSQCIDMVAVIVICIAVLQNRALAYDAASIKHKMAIEISYPLSCLYDIFSRLQVQQINQHCSNKRPSEENLCNDDYNHLNFQNKDYLIIQGVNQCNKICDITTAFSNFNVQDRLIGTDIKGSFLPSSDFLTEKNFSYGGPKLEKSVSVTHSTARYDEGDWSSSWKKEVFHMSDEEQGIIRNTKYNYIEAREALENVENSKEMMISRQVKNKINFLDHCNTKRFEYQENHQKDNDNHNHNFGGIRSNSKMVISTSSSTFQPPLTNHTTVRRHSAAVKASLSSSNKNEAHLQQPPVHKRAGLVSRKPLFMASNDELDNYILKSTNTTNEESKKTDANILSESQNQSQMLPTSLCVNEDVEEIELVGFISACHARNNDFDTFDSQYSYHNNNGTNSKDIFLYPHTDTPSQSSQTMDTDHSRSCSAHSNITFSLGYTAAKRHSYHHSGAKSITPSQCSVFSNSIHNNHNINANLPTVKSVESLPSHRTHAPLNFNSFPSTSLDCYDDYSICSSNAADQSTSYKNTMNNYSYNNSSKGLIIIGNENLTSAKGIAIETGIATETVATTAMGTETVATTVAETGVIISGGGVAGVGSMHYYTSPKLSHASRKVISLDNMRIHRVAYPPLCCDSDAVTVSEDQQTYDDDVSSVNTTTGQALLVNPPTTTSAGVSAMSAASGTGYRASSARSTPLGIPTTHSSTNMHTPHMISTMCHTPVQLTTTTTHPHSHSLSHSHSHSHTGGSGSHRHHQSSLTTTHPSHTHMSHIPMPEIIEQMDYNSFPTHINGYNNNHHCNNEEEDDEDDLSLQSAQTDNHALLKLPLHTLTHTNTHTHTQPVTHTHSQSIEREQEIEIKLSQEENIRLQKMKETRNFFFHQKMAIHQNAYVQSLLCATRSEFRSISFPGRSAVEDLIVKSAEGSYNLTIRSLLDQINVDIQNMADTFTTLFYHYMHNIGFGQNINPTTLTWQIDSLIQFMESVRILNGKVHSTTQHSLEYFQKIKSDIDIIPICDREIVLNRVIIKHQYSGDMSHLILPTTYADDDESRQKEEEWRNKVFYRNSTSNSNTNNSTSNSNSNDSNSRSSDQNILISTDTTTTTTNNNNNNNNNDDEQQDNTTTIIKGKVNKKYQSNDIKHMSSNDSYDDCSSILSSYGS